MPASLRTAYLAYWSSWIAANADSDAKDDLARYTASPLLGVLRSRLRDQAKNGLVARGTVGHDIRGMRVDGPRRHIEDCVDLRGWLLYDAVTGRKVDQLTDRPEQLAVSTLRKVGGQWKVTDGQEPQPC